MAPAFGELKYSTIDIGDATGLVAGSLLSVVNQLIVRYNKATVAYNAANPSLPLPLLDTSYDPETSLKSNTLTLLAANDWDTVAKKFVNKFATYVEAYAAVLWVTPTSGSFEGAESMAEAIDMGIRAVKKGYDLLQPNPFIADPSGLISIADNADGGIEYAIQYLMDESIDAISGDTVFKINNLLTLVDDQQGV